LYVLHAFKFTDKKLNSREASASLVFFFFRNYLALRLNQDVFIMSESETIVTELKMRLTDCQIRLKTLEENSIRQTNELSYLAIQLGKMGLNNTAKIPALLKPKV
jgi:hypothetical protein